MSLTIVDMDAAFIRAQAMTGAWEAEFEAQWNGPLIMAEATQAFLGLPDQERQALKQSDPELYDQLHANATAIVKRMRGAGAQQQPAEPVTEVTAFPTGGPYGQ